MISFEPLLLRASARAALAERARIYEYLILRARSLAVATTGSDGTFNFWDKDSRQRLKAFGKASAPIPTGAFNRDGTIFAYAVSYDWSKGSEHYNPKTNHLLLHPVPEPEIKSRSTGARKGFGARSSR